jgi:hypothetical protein
MTWLYVLLCAEIGIRCESEAPWIESEDVDLEPGSRTSSAGDGRRGGVLRCPVRSARPVTLRRLALGFPKYLPLARL